MEIIPSIIGKDFDEVKAKIGLVAPFVNWIQIDLVDGVFSSQVTWPYDQGGPATAIKQIHFLRASFPNLKLELHLMTDRPEKEIGSWLEAGLDRIIIHFESTAETGAILDKINGAGVSSAIALKLDTKVEEVFAYCPKIEMVQLMGIKEIGAYGQAFAPEVLEKIRTLRKNYSDLILQVDGGINLETAKQVLEAGADNFIAGSAIFKAPSIGEAVRAFRNLAS